LKRVYFFKGSYLKVYSNKLLVETEQPNSTIDLKYEGTVLHINYIAAHVSVPDSGSGGSDIKIYAPEVESAILNGTPVSFVRTGDYITITP
jgi:hypothetical protein